MNMRELKSDMIEVRDKIRIIIHLCIDGYKKDSVHIVSEIVYNLHGTGKTAYYVNKENICLFEGEFEKV